MWRIALGVVVILVMAIGLYYLGAKIPPSNNSSGDG